MISESNPSKDKRQRLCSPPPPLWVGYRLALTAKTVTCLSSPKTPDRKVKLSNDDETRYIDTKVNNMLDIKNVSSCRPSPPSSSWSWVFLRCHERSVQLGPTLGGERDRETETSENLHKDPAQPSQYQPAVGKRRPPPWGQCFQNSL